MEITDPSRFGITTFEQPQIEEIVISGGRKIAVSRAPGRWQPPQRLANFLRTDFSVPLDCYTGRNGLRRIRPRCNFEELIDLGTVGGVAVIHGSRGFDEERHETYRNMLLIHQHVCGRTRFATRGMKEHLTREFEYSRDLYVRRSGRLADDERDVLPDDMGLTAQGEGRRLTVTKLMELGRQAAHAAGHSNPISKVAVAYGLYEAAKLNPLEVEVEKVPVLVRSALFDIEPWQDALSAERVEIVMERLLEAVDSHRDDSQNEFHEWFFGPHNSLVKQIAQQKSKQGGKLTREIVRRAVLEHGVRAFEYVGPCVNALMRTIKNSMAPPLNDEEKRLFEHMLESQPYYGNVPAAMLAERMQGLEIGVLAIWNEPQNQVHVRVLHRLLHYYAEMAQKRRGADSQSKKRRQRGTQGAPQKSRRC